MEILHQFSRNVNFSVRTRFYLCCQVLKLVLSILWTVGEEKKISDVIRRQVLSNGLACHQWRHLLIRRFGNNSGLPCNIAGIELL